MALWKKSDEKSTPSVNSSRRGAEQVSEATESKAANGTASELSADRLRQIAGAAKAATATFGEIVTLLMRSPQYKHYSLSDLEWLVAPALLNGQFSVATAQSKTQGLVAPVGLVLWASVSDEVDKRLIAAAGQPIRLQPQEWKSGEFLWVVLAAGDGRVVQGILKQLQEKQWTNKSVKFVTRGKDGKPGVTTLENRAP